MKIIKEFISTIILIILIIIMIAILSVLGIIVYAEINEEDVVAQQFLADGYNIINEALKGKEEQQEIEQVEENQLNNVESLDNITSNTQEISNYYYEQLNDYSKIIYRKLEENKDNMKTGTYTINFGESFSDLLREENGSELLEDYYQSAIETYLYDNPEVFYLSPKKMYINIQTTKGRFTTKYEVYLDCGENNNYLADGYESKEQIEQIESEIQNIKNTILTNIENKSEYEKIKEIHDYLVDNISYEETISKNDIYNICGALIRKECVCEGYAKAFKYLLDEANIESIIVVGEATNSESKTENHAWNYVKIEEDWYAVDVTWDDPIVKGWGNVGNSSRYKYFLVGSNEMNKDHKLSAQFTKDGQEYQYPELKN